MNVDPLLWRGAATLYEGQDATGRAVEVTLTATGISLRTRQGTRQFQLSALRARLQGMNDQARLELPAPSRGVLLIPDPAGVAALRRTRLLPRRRRRGPLLLACLVVLAGGVTFFFTHGLDLLVGWAVRLVPAEAEASLGRHLLESTLREHPRLDDAATRETLAKCMRELHGSGSAGQDAPEFAALEIALVDDSTANAFALPGGAVVVCTGLVALMENQSEFLGVLAHELGHVHMRHGLRRVARTAGLGFIAAAVVGDVNGLSAIVLDQSALLLGLSYDRKEERAADDYAVRLLGSRQLDGSGLLTLLERLEAEASGPSLPGFLSTHPPTAERLARLRQSLVATPEARTLLSEEEWNGLRRRAAGEPG
ncbi:MAG TPA: M48 family metallopeptidase [Candidatus Krumholzibacteria bacterium]|nr:M48 family metallopeptidase [Candidatus Krumholzibacteria bacterium]